MSDLVERLRGDFIPHKWCREAADEIERLRAEQDALRAALVDIRDAGYIEASDCENAAREALVASAQRVLDAVSTRLP